MKLLRDGQVVKDVSSDAEGNFSFDALASGRYQIEVSAPGFSTRTTDPVFVAGGARVSVDVALPIGPLEESVSVTSAATGVLPSQTGAPVTVLDAKTLEILGKTDVLEALRLVPGSSLVESGAKGGVTSMFIRGGNSNFNKVLIDGIPANDIGGGIDLAQFSMAGVDRIEVLREANSVIAGTDALAGVISITSRRGRTRVPEALITLDAGNFSTNHEAASLGGTVGRFDYFSEFAHFGTDNDLPNNKYRNKTYAGRFGGAIAHNTDLSGTVRWIDRRFESPNGVSFYTTPDDAFQTNRLYFVGIGSQTQITQKWQGSVRVGLSDQRAHFINPTLSGQNIGGTGFGAPTTITGANGYSVTGQAALDYGTYDSQSRSARQGFYAQTTYELHRNLSVSGGGDAEREQAFPGDDIHGEPTTTRNNSALWVEGRGTLGNRSQPDRRDRPRPHRGVRLTLLAAALGGGLAADPDGQAVFRRHQADVQRWQGHQSHQRGCGQQIALHAAAENAGGRGAGGERRHRTDRSRARPAISMSASSRGYGEGARVPASPISTTSSSI